MDARPEDLFSFDSNERIISVSNDIDPFSPQNLNDLSNNDISPTDLVFTWATPTSEYDADPYNLEADDLLPDEDHSVDTDPFLQGASACEAEDRLSWVDDGASYLKPRDGALCTLSKSNANIDLFEDPKPFLRQNIPPTKVPTGQTNQPEQDDEFFNFETLLNNRPVSFLFQEDGEKCPFEDFDLSTTPVCLDSLKGSAIGSPGSGFTLHDVEPCRSCFHVTIAAEFLARLRY